MQSYIATKKRVNHPMNMHAISHNLYYVKLWADLLKLLLSRVSADSILNIRLALSYSFVCRAAALAIAVGIYKRRMPAFLRTVHRDGRVG